MDFNGDVRHVLAAGKDIRTVVVLALLQAYVGAYVHLSLPLVCCSFGQGQCVGSTVEIPCGISDLCPTGCIEETRFFFSCFGKEVVFGIIDESWPAAHLGIVYSESTFNCSYAYAVAVSEFDFHSIFAGFAVVAAECVGGGICFAVNNPYRIHTFAVEAEGSIVGGLP